MAEREPHHHRIETRLETVSTGLCLVARAVAISGTGVSETIMPLSALEDGSGIAALVQWAERLPWDNEEWRSKHASYHESILTERRGPGGSDGWKVEAFNDFTEDLTDSTHIGDDGLRDPETWRRVLQWAESLGTLT